MYRIDGGEDMPLLFDITVGYKDENGNMVEETVSALPWEKRLQAVTLPFTAEVEAKCAKSKESPAKGSYEVNMEAGVFYKTTDGRATMHGSTSRMTIGADKVEEYRNKTTEREFKAREEIL